MKSSREPHAQRKLSIINSSRVPVAAASITKRPSGDALIPSISSTAGGMALSREQEGTLLDNCLLNRSRTLHPAVALALYTGLRRGELLSLRWAQIDLEKATLMVDRSKTRAGRDRVAPLNTTVRMARRYGHIGQEATRAAMARLDGVAAPAPAEETTQPPPPSSTTVH